MHMKIAEREKKKEEERGKMKTQKTRRLVFEFPISIKGILTLYRLCF